MSDEAIKNKERYLPMWVKSFIAITLTLVTATNTIGLNLTQINTAVTNYIVNKIDGRPNKEFEDRILKLEQEIEQLKEFSHKPN